MFLFLFLMSSFFPSFDIVVTIMRWMSYTPYLIPHTLYLNMRSINVCPLLSCLSIHAALCVCICRSSHSLTVFCIVRAWLHSKLVEVEVEVEVDVASAR